jgi:hypothetical protein
MLESEKHLAKRLGCSLAWIRKTRIKELSEDNHWKYDESSKRRVKPVVYTDAGKTIIENAFIAYMDEKTKDIVDNIVEAHLPIGTVAAKFNNPRLVKIIVGNGEPELCQVRDNRSMNIGMEIPVRKNFGTSTPWTLELRRINDGKHRFISLEKLIRANKF